MNSETQTRVTMSPLTPVKTFYEETEYCNSGISDNKTDLIVCVCVSSYRTQRKRAISVWPGCNGRVAVGADGADSCTADFRPS